MYKFIEGLIITCFIILIFNAVNFARKLEIPEFMKTAYATSTTNTHNYDGSPYGARNFDEWMSAWKEDVRQLLERQNIEWEKEFGDNNLRR